MTEEEFHESEEDRVIMIDTVEDVITTCAHLSTHRRLAVDIEGVDLCREGLISIIQIATPDSTVYIFDITTLKIDAFTHGLRDVFSNLNIEKVFFDARSDCDALHHLFDSLPRKILDCQIAYMMSSSSLRNSRYVKGFTSAIVDSSSLSFPKKTQIGKLKARGLKLFAPDKGGSYDVWEERPLNRVLVDYAASDVTSLLKIFEEYADQARTAGLTHSRLLEISERRAHHIVHNSEVPRGRRMSVKDF